MGKRKQTVRLQRLLVLAPSRRELVRLASALESLPRLAEELRLAIQEIRALKPRVRMSKTSTADGIGAAANDEPQAPAQRG